MEEAPLFYGIATYACGNVLSDGIGKACAVVVLEHFQFETLCVSNHTACRFAEKTRFFRSLLAGRRCAAASRFTFFKVEKLCVKK
ncbi:hypothetical protein QUW15_06130 [Desulfovibrio piger]|nr:hypothetical protein [Desulfovibrio piger]